MVEAAESQVAALCGDCTLDDVRQRQEQHAVSARARYIEINASSQTQLRRSLQLRWRVVRYVLTQVMFFPPDIELTLVVLNMHELAVTSGFAAAYQLGADYPFKGDEDCERLFRLYLALSHGARLVRP